jgi:hypothetical protein
MLRKMSQIVAKVTRMPDFRDFRVAGRADYEKAWRPEQRLIAYIRIPKYVSANLLLAKWLCQASLPTLFSIRRQCMRYLLGGYLWIVVLF